MPEEKVKAQIADVDAYLVEVRSIGGISGSPVFVVMSRPTFFEGITGQPSSGHKIVFLGLIHGHWNMPAVRQTDSQGNQVVIDEAINQGIAMVVPSSKIVDVLEQLQLKSERDAYDIAMGIELPA